MLPKTGPLESFGIISAPVLLHSKVEVKKHRDPQGINKPKETFHNGNQPRKEGQLSLVPRASLLILPVLEKAN